MKKIIFITVIHVLFFSTGFSQYQGDGFRVPGYIAVLQVGSGTDPLSSAGFPVNIKQFDPSSQLIIDNNNIFPVAPFLKDRSLLISGTAKSEGKLTRSYDKRFLLLTGYDTLFTPSRLSINTSLATDINRVVGEINRFGLINTKTVLNDAYTTGDIRCAVSTNGYDIWMAGTGTAATSGIRYTTRGANSSIRVNASGAGTLSNVRVVNIIDSSLYCSSQSGAYTGLSKIGTGIPSDTGEQVVPLPGMPGFGATNSMYDFAINDTKTIAYIADGGSLNALGGIQKWVNNGGTWSMAYILRSGLPATVLNMLVDWKTDSAYPHIYGTTDETVPADSMGNHLVSVIDSGDATSTFKILARSPVNTVYRGLAPIPEYVGFLPVYKFVGDGNWSDLANWLNNDRPEFGVNGDCEIIIDPVNVCILDMIIDDAILIGRGVKLIIRPNKQFIIPGDLIIHND